MIDWLTVQISFRHKFPINAGEITKITRDGLIEWSTKTRESVEGSYSSTISVCSVPSSLDSEGYYNQFSISGNFAKFFQGHNLFGTEDLTGLTCMTFISICKLLDLYPYPEEIDAVFNGNFTITRIDITKMVDLKSPAHVQAFLYAAERGAHWKRRGIGVMKKGTLYFAQNSERSTLKLYAKGPEFKKRAPKYLPFYNSLQEWSDTKLRIELTLRSKELKRRNLFYAKDWQENDINTQWLEAVKLMDMNDTFTVPPEKLAELAPRYTAIYHLWNEGHDLKAMYPERTFFRYKNLIKEKLGIDISTRKPKDTTGPKVLNFIEVIELTACDQYPHWAENTELFYEPPKFLKQQLMLIQ